ncbi:MAG: D-glycero-beta-D-manno-heptose-1,7-bisphosphate 7-phosphatase [Phycisphaerae bacterium]|nr:D-glycero-beta-D-manno-heptose-1,7-bisphosphate 7-phosphatase [Phycisphaerae bacterium]
MLAGGKGLMLMPRAVFLDRDKTLIADPGYISDPDQVHLLPGVGPAIQQLRQAGYLAILVTNQSGIARGLLTEKQLAAIHTRLQDLLRAEGTRLDAIYYCPYLDGPEAIIPQFRRASDWRKPQPGMLLAAARDHQLLLEQCWLIGDSHRDILAGQAAGCRTLLIDQNPPVQPNITPDAICPTLKSAADWIIRSTT